MTGYRIAHLSDLHLDGGARAAGRVRRVVQELQGLREPVDAVIVTGDVADSGRPEQYAQARALLDLPAPTLLCPGNHDERAAFRAAFGPPGVADDAGPVNRAEVVGGVLFALCDSTRPGRDDGLLAEASLRWLDEVLAAEPARPAVLALHHPPVALHSPLLDPIRLHGEQALAEVLDRHPSVVAVLCGHAHTAAAADFAGRPLRVDCLHAAPAVGSRAGDRPRGTAGVRLPRARRRPAADHPRPRRVLTGGGLRRRAGARQYGTLPTMPPCPRSPPGPRPGPGSSSRRR